MPMSAANRERSSRLAWLVLTIGFVALGLWVAAGFLKALAWGAIIAVAVDPLYRRAELHWPRLRRTVLPATVTVALFLLLLVPLLIGLVQLPREAHALATWLSAARHDGIPLPAWVAQLPFGRAEVTNWWQDALATPEGAEHWFKRVDATAMAQSRPLGAAALRGLITFIMALLTLFFLLRERDALIVQLLTASDKLFGASGKRVGHQLLQSVQGTINGLVLVGLGEGAVLGVAYLLLGAPHPVLLGALTGVAAMIPLGAALLVGIAAILLLIQGSAGGAVAIIVFGLLVIGIADHVLRPILIGGATKLPFLGVLIGILGGVESLGIIGLFVGPATMAVLIMLWRDYVEPA